MVSFHLGGNGRLQEHRVSKTPGGNDIRLYHSLENELIKAGLIPGRQRATRGGIGTGTQRVPTVLRFEGEAIFEEALFPFEATTGVARDVLNQYCHEAIPVEIRQLGSGRQ